MFFFVPVLSYDAILKPDLYKCMYTSAKTCAFVDGLVYNMIMKNKPCRRKTITRIAALLFLLILLFYAVAGNLIVSAALVPEFMRKLDAFEEITEESYSQMIYTDDITENTRAASQETREWLETVDLKKYSLTSDDGYQLIASVFYQPEELPKEERHRWVMLLHGYTGWKEEMYHYACRYYAQGFNVICPDMRCQGESEGDFIGMGYTDSRDNLLWLLAILHTDPDARIVIHGESMGASCALMMSGLKDLPENVACIISDCGYSDVRSIFKKELNDWTGLPDIGLTFASRLCLLARGGYDIRKASALEAVRVSHTPTLFIHGLQDRFVPPYMEDRLFEACSSSKQLMKMEGAGHVQSVYKDPDAYYDTVFDFIDQWL